MASKGSKKELSVRHETAVANAYEGKRSNSSGAHISDQGDVLTHSTLFECKGQFGELAGQRPVRATVLTQFEKIADEAFEIGKEPALALRFYAPESALADHSGWVDLVVRMMVDDMTRGGQS